MKRPPVVSRQIAAPKFNWSKVDLQEVSRDLRAAHACARDVLFAQVFAALHGAAAQAKPGEPRRPAGNRDGKRGIAACG